MGATIRKIRQSTSAACFAYSQKNIVTWSKGKKLKIIFYSLLVIISRIFFRIFGGGGNKHQYPVQESLFPELLCNELKSKIKRLTGLSVLPSSIFLYELQKYDTLKKYSFSINTSKSPVVSIIIPVFNNCIYTFNCLLSLHNVLKKSNILTEIIVINDGSNDETLALLQQVTGIQIITNSPNIGFLQSCNKGVSITKGKYILLLNNDVQAVSDFISPLVAVMEKNDDAGAVGGKLIYPNGLLQEAGCYIFADGNAINIGRMEHPDFWQYNFLKEVDYCSAALLLIRKSDWLLSGGFDNRFIPAYCEDADICFTLKHRLRKKIIYTPLSSIIHFEGVSGGTELDGPVKKYQVINTKKFIDKWEGILNNIPETLPVFRSTNYKAIRKVAKRKKVLIVYPAIPEFNKDAGANRITNIIKLISSIADVYLFTKDYYVKKESLYAKALRESGCRIVYRHDAEKDSSHNLQNILPHNFDFVWLTGYQMAENYFDIIKQHSHSTIIYDTVDLHFLRFQRSEAIQKNMANESMSIKEKELHFIKEANISFVVSTVELAILKELAIGNVHLLSIIHEPSFAEGALFDERSGLLFIGGFNHLPNKDAVLWLHAEVMPLVWKQDPSIRVNIIGSHPPPDVLALNNERFAIHGFVENVSPLFLKNKLLICPLRFGAGVKGKIGQALEFQLPVVTTQIGAEGMNLQNGSTCLIADTAEDFADAIINVYNNSVLWSALHKNSHAALSPFSKETASNQLNKLINGELKN